MELTLVLPHVSLPTSSARFGSLVIRKLSKIVPDLTYIREVNSNAHFTIIPSHFTIIKTNAITKKTLEIFKMTTASQFPLC